MKTIIAGLILLCMGQNGFSLADREARISAAVEMFSIVGVVDDYMSQEDDTAVLNMAQGILGGEFTNFTRYLTSKLNELETARSVAPLTKLKYLHKLPAIYCLNLNNNGVRFGNFSDSKVSIHKKDISGNLVVLVEDSKSNSKKFYLLDGSQHLSHEDGYAFAAERYFFKTGKVIQVESMDKRLAVIEDAESDNWRGILNEARNRSATIVAKFKADSQARIVAKKAAMIPPPPPKAPDAPRLIVPNVPANVPVNREEAERLEAERKAAEVMARDAARAAAAKAAAESRKKALEQKAINAKINIQSIVDSMGGSIRNYTRLDKEMPPGWEKQIVFSVNAIKNHIKKLETEKVSLMKSDVDQTTVANLTIIANTAINDGNAILKKWSEFNK